MANKRLFIDVTPVCRSGRSGVGYSLLQLLQAIDGSQQITDEFQLVAFAPRSLMRKTTDMSQFKHIQLVELPLPAKLFQILFRLGILPPIDLFLGKGLYCFYDYRLLPLTKSSSALVCIHDLTFLKYPQFLETKNLRYLRRIIPKSVRRARVIVCVSESAKAELSAAYPKESDKLETLYNTLDYKAFVRQSGDVIRQVKEKYGLPPDPSLLFIGNIEPRKNISSLLAAYEKLGEPSKLPPVVMVGAMSWGDESVRSQIDTLKRKGYRITSPSAFVVDEDIPALISGAYCLVMPSFYEGFGYPPLQAVLCGTTAIVSENMPVNEVIGEYTVKVNPGDVDQISRVLRDIINKGYRENPVARDKISRRIGYETTATQFLSLVRKMTRERS